MRAPQRGSGLGIDSAAPKTNAENVKQHCCDSGRPTKQNLPKEQTATYQAAFEAVLAVPISTGFGYWIDHTYDTSPVGLGIGAVIGFAAMVLRLVKMRPSEGLQEAGSDEGSKSAGETAARKSKHEQGRSGE